MKHIKKFNKFEQTNESLMDYLSYFIIGDLLYRFLKGFILSRLRNKFDDFREKNAQDTISDFLSELKKMGKIPVSEFADRFFMRIQSKNGHEYDLRLLKEEKVLIISGDNNLDEEIPLSDEQFDDFLKLIKQS